MERIVRRPTVLLVLAAIGALTGGCWLLAPPARGAVRTARLMPAFFVGLPVSPEQWGRGEPLVSVEPIEAASGPAALHTYRPAHGRHPALLLSLGVNPAPPDDPRVTRLLGGLARSGLVAVLVESAALNDDRITPEAPDLLVRAFERVAAEPYVRADRIGFAGFSVGAGLVSVAAADPRIGDRVRLVEAFGGYYNLEDVVAAVTTRSLRDGASFRPWDPDPLPREVIARNLIAALASPAEREAVTTLVAPPAQPANGQPSVSVSALSPHARAVYDVLANTDPTRAAELYARLPESQRAELRAVSPAAHVDGLRAPIYLMHDRGDPLLPYTETRRFAAALTALGRPPYESEFDIFEHVDPTRGGNPTIVARDSVRLFLHIQAVLARLD